jgi:hypothetical protein
MGMTPSLHVRELREWIRAAEAARPTCINVTEFDVLIRHQKWRLAKALPKQAVTMGEEIRKDDQNSVKQLKPVVYYSDEALKEIKAEYQTINGKLNHLVEEYSFLSLKNSRAKEFSTQGYPRRLKIIVRCIDNVFRIIPPDRSALPSRDELSDTTINIQGFVFNVFGSIDNLAWILVLEKGRKLPDGRPIPDTHIGLGPNNKGVRATLSKEFQNYLTRLDNWFAHITDLRHALAHRIPLYIPPYVIQAADEIAYKDFEAKMADAIRKHDFASYDQLSVEQMKLGRFRPWVQHSFEENAVPIVFHAQMLADFNTVEELGRKMLDELSR